MRDLDKALADIIAIRSQLAAGTAFRGYGPATIAATSGVALVTAILQHVLLAEPTANPLAFLFGWAAAATLSAALIWIEMLARSRRHHSGLADAMIHQAVEQFLPAGIAACICFAIRYTLYRKVNSGGRGQQGVQTEEMRDLDKALADIIAIRSQLAAGTAFRGYGPATIAATSGVALVTAILQHFLLAEPTANPLTFLFGWAAAATLSAAMIWIEMLARSRRHHSGLADAMIHQAVEQFLPAGIAGVLLAVMLWKFAPETLWLLPGLWQILVSLGMFASVRSLPRTVAFAGAWYFIAGFVVLVIASHSHALSPWTMGLPFVIGQLLMATIIHFASGESDAEE